MNCCKLKPKIIIANTSFFKTLVLIELFMAVLFSLTFAQEIFVVKDPKANIRSGPGTAYQIIYTAMAGEEFLVRDSSGKWLKILLPDGDEGWIHQNLGTIKRKEKKVEIKKSPRTYKKAKSTPGLKYTPTIGNQGWVFTIKSVLPKSYNMEELYPMNTAQIARMLNEKFGITFGFYLYTYTYTYTYKDSSLKSSRSILIPQLGVKYCFWSYGLMPYIHGTISRTFEDVNKLCLGFAFGTECILNKYFSIGGEFGYQYFSYNIESNYGIQKESYRVGLTYPAITLNFYY